MIFATRSESAAPNTQAKLNAGAASIANASVTTISNYINSTAFIASMLS